MTLHIGLCCPTALSTRVAEVTVQHWEWHLKHEFIVFSGLAEGAAQLPWLLGVCCTSALWACGGKYPPKLFPSQWSSVWTAQEPKAKIQSKIRINRRSFQAEKIIPTAKCHPMDSCLTLKSILLFLCWARLEETERQFLGSALRVAVRAGNTHSTCLSMAWSPQHGTVITCSSPTCGEWLCVQAGDSLCTYPDSKGTMFVVHS